MKNVGAVSTMEQNKGTMEQNKNTVCINCGNDRSHLAPGQPCQIQCPECREVCGGTAATDLCGAAGNWQCGCRRIEGYEQDIAETKRLIKVLERKKAFAEQKLLEELHKKMNAGQTE